MTDDGKGMKNGANGGKYLQNSYQLKLFLKYKNLRSKQQSELSS